MVWLEGTIPNLRRKKRCQAKGDAIPKRAKRPPKTSQSKSDQLVG